MTLREAYYRQGRELAASSLKAEHAIVGFNPLTDLNLPTSYPLREVALEGLLLGFVSEAKDRGWRYKFRSGVEVICWLPKEVTS